MSTLTEAQEAVLAFMTRHQSEHGRPPSLREICTEFGYESYNAARKHVLALAKKGMVSQTGDGRTWAVTNAREVQGMLFTVPLFGTIPAGLTADNAQISDEQIRIDPATFGLKSAKGLFALKVRGDSMIGAQIADGDIALLRDQPVKVGDIIAALIDGESTLKRFVKDRGKPVLRAENPRYRDLIPAESLSPQGVLVGVVGRGKR